MNNNIRDIFFKAASDYFQTQSNEEINLALEKAQSNGVTFLIDKLWIEALTQEHNQRMEDEDDKRDPNDCAECARSYGPWYTGECEH